MRDKRSEKEMNDLETHVLLCAERYDDVRDVLGKQNIWIYVIAGIEALRLIGVDSVGIIKVLFHAG
jgi:hypothetical protein